VGIAAYGADSGARDFAPAMALLSRIVFIKDAPPGRPISYGATYVTREPTRVGVVAAGYGNGYPRLASNRGYVLVGGRVAPILGRICMDQMMVSLNGHPEAVVGDPVLLFGRRDDDVLPVWKVAEWAETISYEILCSVGAMNPRVYLRSAGPGGGSATGGV
jgi:alanine racemase